MSIGVEVTPPTPVAIEITINDGEGIDVTFGESIAVDVANIGDAPRPLPVNAGDGLELVASALNAVVHSDGSLVIDPSENVPRGALRVGVISDTQHGDRSGGSLHAVATAVLDGFMSAADKTKLDALIANAVPDTRILTAGIGLTGGGDLTADRTFDVVGFRETSGPTDLTYAGIADGFVLARSGTDVIGIDPSTFGTGDVVGPAGATDEAIARFDTATGKLLQDSVGILDDAGNLSGLADITLSGTVDGRDVSADGIVLDTHVADVANPHATDLGNLGTGTLAELNAVVTDADLVPEVRTLTAGIALTGGGDLSSNRTFDVDVASLEPLIDHTAITNIGTNTHAQIDTHIADGSIHFADAPSDGTPYARQDAGWVSAGGEVTSLTLTGFFNTILNLNQTIGASPLTVDLAPVVNLVSLQTAYGNGETITIDGTPTPISIEASVAGQVLGIEDVANNDVMTVSVDPDEVLINATIYGDTAASGELVLRGTSNANLGLIRSHSPIVWEDTAPANALSAYFAEVPLAVSQAFTAGFIGGGFNASPTITFSASTFIWEGMRIAPNIRSLTSPAFAAFTMFQGLPLLRAGSGGTHNPLSPLVINAGPTVQNEFSGARTTASCSAINWAPTVKATVSGAVMSVTNMTGLTNAPKFSTVGGSTISFGTIRGLWCQNPAAGLFQPGAGAEVMTGYHAVDVDAIPFGGNVAKSALRSALTTASNTRFLRNTGGADSDLGGGDLLNCGTVQIDGDNIGLELGEGQDVELLWDGSRYVIDPASGSDLRYTFGAGFVTLDASTALELRFNTARFAFGQSGAVGNQVGIFVAPTRSVAVAGEWSDFLLSQGGNLTVNAAMTRVSAWTVSAPGITLGTGTVTNAAGLLVSGEPNQGSNHRVGLHVLSNPSGGGGVNAALYVENGLARFDGGVDINDGVALGGGATPTLGTIGGSGPTTAAQAQWLQIDIGGTTHWIPVWT